MTASGPATGYSARYRHADEATLIAWAKAGDQTAFTVLATNARRRLTAVCYRSCADTGDAADACQDALLAAWQNMGSFRGESGFTTWLCAIGVNACRAIQRRHRPQPTADDPTPPHTDPASDVDLRDVVNRALWQLDEPVRTAVVLREYGDLSYEQIAATLGVALNTVRTRIHRGRRQLATLLLEGSR